MVFHWRLSDSKSPQVSRTRLSILANLNVVVLIVSTRPLISKSSSPCPNPLMTVPNAPITIIWYHRHFQFHNFFQFSCTVQVFISLRFSLILLSGQPERRSSLFGRFLSCGQVTWPRFK